MCRKLIIALLMLRSLCGSVVCCCTLHVWSAALLGSDEIDSGCCCQSFPDGESSNSSPDRHDHRCRCRNGMEAATRAKFVKFTVSLFRSGFVNEWLSHLATIADPPSAVDHEVLRSHRHAVTDDALPLSGTEILRLLQTMRC